MKRTIPLLALGLVLATLRADAGAPTIPPSRTHEDAGPSVRPPTAAAHVGSHGSTVIVTANGPLVAERNAGAVIRTDASGAAVARLDLHEGLGELVHDGKGRVFVADRRADRVVQIDDAADGLSIARSVPVVEPFGLALTPDGKTLLATSVADHELVAIDTKDLSIRWKLALAPEPRGVAVSADGKQAAVGLLSRGLLAIVDLDAKAPTLHWQTLDPRDQVVVVEEEEVDDWGGGPTIEIREAPSRFRVPQGTGRRAARNTFAVGWLADGRVIASHQLSTPEMVFKPGRDESDSYGGIKTIPPVVHQVSLVAAPGSARARHRATEIAVHQPRALAYDLATDTLFVGGYGDDRVIAIADATQALPRTRWNVDVSKHGACGIDGLAIEGNQLWVHCELSRKLVSLSTNPQIEDKKVVAKLARRGPELAASLRSAEVERGAEVFRRANDSSISSDGTLACANCHPEGRADGLSWRLGPTILQTPMLTGRLVGTQPFKWDGHDADLEHSIEHTMQRLGGSPEFVPRRDKAALVAYLESLPKPRSKSIGDADAVARGRVLFEGNELDCASCHDGDTLTDNAQHALESNLATTDTPSLVGLAHTAPYYHDGSAGDLHALLTDRGTIHDMADVSKLNEKQRIDLLAYLESL